MKRSRLPKKKKHPDMYVGVMCYRWNPLKQAYIRHVAGDR